MSNLSYNVAKYTGIYRCSDSISNFVIRVRIKEIPDITTASESELKENWETGVFKWQDKVFNQYEKEYYINETNCVTDLEKKYHSKLTNNGEQDSTKKFLFTYVNDDNTDFEFEDFKFSNASLFRQSDANNLEEITEENQEFDYKQFLTMSLENSYCVDNFTKMYIMADTGQYIGEKWVKFEHTLCVIKYDKGRHLLTIYPDFNTLPYLLQTEIDSTKKYYYYIENASEKVPKELWLKENKILKKFNEGQKLIKNPFGENDFKLPAKDKLEAHLFFEIVSGSKFEHDDIYVQYFVDLPDCWTCQNVESLRGVTQTCRSNLDSDVFFGHHFEMTLEYDILRREPTEFPKSPYIYFGVISKDTWERFRSEGLSYHCLPIAKPGYYEKNLHCFRFGPQHFSDGLKRFFIGDCSNYSDITWVGVPKLHEDDVLNKFGVNTIGTGILQIRVNVLHQSQAFLTKYNEGKAITNKQKFIFEKLNSSSLIKSVEEVVQAFKTARKNMKEARKNV